VPEAVILDAVRTPIGAFCKTLTPVRPDDLLALTIRTFRFPTFPTCIWAAPTKPARTIAMSPAWPPCWLGFPKAFQV
jgi:hypothetical protein